MIDLLISIPGQQFLFLFLLYEAFCIFIARHFINNIDGSKGYSLPPVTGFSSYYIATLKGGWKTVVESSLYGLWKRDLIDLKHTSHILKSSAIEAVRKKSKNITLNVIENIIYNYFHHRRNIREIFDDEDIKTSVNTKIASYIQELQAKHLLKRSGDLTKGFIIVAFTFFAIYLIGITKLYLGIMRDKPIGFLSVILVITPFIIFLILKPTRPQTVLGIAYLELLKKNFEWMKEKARYDDLNGIDPVHVAAIFGVAAISADAGFANAINRSTGNYGGGCGASAGCGGGGCGGGGCGGGCGGCGG